MPWRCATEGACGSAPLGYKRGGTPQGGYGGASAPVKNYPREIQEDGIGDFPAKCGIVRRCKRGGPLRSYEGNHNLQRLDRNLVNRLGKDKLHPKDNIGFPCNHKELLNSYF